MNPMFSFFEAAPRSSPLGRIVSATPVWITRRREWVRKLGESMKRIVKRTGHEGNHDEPPLKLTSPLPLEYSHRMRAIPATLCLPIAIVAALSISTAGERDEKVNKEKATLADSDLWIYNDLDEAFTKSRASGKPMMVVCRCIP